MRHKCFREQRCPGFCPKKMPGKFYKNQMSKWSIWICSCSCTLPLTSQSWSILLKKDWKQATVLKSVSMYKMWPEHSLANIATDMGQHIETSTNAGISSENPWNTECCKSWILNASNKCWRSRFWHDCPSETGARYHIGTSSHLLEPNKLTSRRK